MTTLNPDVRDALGAVVDLRRYPIDRPDSPEYAQLRERCREQLTAAGACQLHGFMRAQAVQRLVGEAEALRPHAHRTDDTHNAYFEPSDAALSADDARALPQRSAKLTIGYDRIAVDSPLRRLYEADALTGFIRDALGAPALYRDADSSGALSLAIFERADELGWHFDRSEFAVTLMLAPARDGGDYEYVQNLRSEADENLDGVQAVLQGRAPGSVVSLGSEPGTLSLFRGRFSLHRVTPNRAGAPRINAVLAYAQTPGHVLNAVTRELFYGAPATP
jgi:hypothetical protein